MKPPFRLRLRVHWLSVRAHLAVRLLPSGAPLFGQLRQEAHELDKALEPYA